MNVASEMPIVANARLGGRKPVMLAAVGAGPALAVVADMDMASSLVIPAKAGIQ
jgi:hypothetical protein